LTETRNDKALLRFRKQISRGDPVIVDEFGCVPFSETGAEFLFEFFAERYERGSVMVTTNLSFDQWIEVPGSERITGALLDRLNHRVHIPEMNGESYRFRESVRRTGKKAALQNPIDNNKAETNEKKKEKND
jgi:DNA replication protein DnaC